MNRLPEQGSVSVWQPQGFEGLEVELLSNVLSDFARFQSSFEFSLLLDSFGRMNYLKHSIVADNRGKEDLFAAQHVGELVRVEQTQPEGRSTVLTLKFDDTLFSQLLDQEKQSSHLPYFTGLFAPDAHNAFLSQLLARAIQSFTEPTSHLERQSRLVGLVQKATRLCSDTGLLSPSLRPEHHAVRTAKDYLQHHFCTEVSLDDLTHLTGLSKSYLIGVFKRSVGISPHAFQTHLRIHRAKELLRRGWAIAQVAFETGFVDQAHLSRQFKRSVLVTPGAYQRACSWSQA
jgi:AraC-like DNA-binding protein